jgi:glycosyltransferase involved in cell wall biosynthesis
MIDVFTPRYADEENTNAQALTVKEIVARLDPDRFRVLMLCKGVPDARLKERPNTRFVPWVRRGNTPHILIRCLHFAPHIYFYPGATPLDVPFFWIKRKFHLTTAIVAHIVSGGFHEAEVPPNLLRLLRQTDAVFGNNRFLSLALEEYTGCSVRTIYNGIDRRFFFPSPDSKKQKSEVLTVLYAGSFRSYKRADVVVREAANHPNVEFRLAGMGEEELACRRLANELNCHNVHFLGHLSQQELGNEMRRSDVFFFPSAVEGHPQVLGQAAACGLPCVALGRYHPDYVVNGRTGFLASSHEEMGDRLSDLLNNPGVRCSMGGAAIVHAARFDWNQIAREWQDVFVEVVARRRHS